MIARPDPAIAAIAVGFLIFALAAMPTALSGAEEDRLVATVGGREIRFSEIRQAAQGLNRFLKENFETSPAWRQEFIRTYVAQCALARRAEREGLERDPGVRFEAAHSRRVILANALVQRRTEGLRVGEDEIRAYYEGNKPRYQIKERIKVSALLAEKREEAERIAAQLRRGKSFERVAGKKRKAVDSWISKDAPGVPGLEAIPPERWNEAFALKPGRTQGPIETEKGVFFIHVEAAEPARDRPLEEVRQQVRFECDKELRDQAVAELIRETFAQEGVELHEEPQK